MYIIYFGLGEKREKTQRYPREERGWVERERAGMDCSGNETARLILEVQQQVQRQLQSIEASHSAHLAKQKNELQSILGDLQGIEGKMVANARSATSVSTAQIKSLIAAEVRKLFEHELSRPMDQQPQSQDLVAQQQWLLSQQNRMAERQLCERIQRRMESDDVFSDDVPDLVAAAKEGLEFDLKQQQAELSKALQDVQGRIKVFLKANVVPASTFFDAWETRVQSMAAQEDEVLQMHNSVQLIKHSVDDMQSSLDTKPVKCCVDKYTARCIARCMFEEQPTGTSNGVVPVGTELTVFRVNPYDEDNIATKLTVESEEKLRGGDVCTYLKIKLGSTGFSMESDSMLNYKNLMDIHKKMQQVTGSSDLESVCVQRYDTVLLDINMSPDVTKRLWVPCVVLKVNTGSKRDDRKRHRSESRMILLVFDTFKVDNAVVEWFPSIYCVFDYKQLVLNGQMLCASSRSVMVEALLRLPQDNILSLLRGKGRMPPLYISILQDVMKSEAAHDVHALTLKYCKKLT